MVGVVAESVAVGQRKIMKCSMRAAPVSPLLGEFLEKVKCLKYLGSHDKKICQVETEGKFRRKVE